jgi:hypothetical protein
MSSTDENNSDLDSVNRVRCLRANTEEKMVKVKFTIKQAMKAQRGSRGIALLFL